MRSAPRAILYARVSTVLQEHPDAQLGELRRVAVSRGWSIETEVVERASGADRKRPRLAEVMAAIAAGRANILAAVSLDRVTRSVGHLIELVDDLQSYSAELVCPRDGQLDTTTAQGRAFLVVRGVFAELERELARERAREFSRERAAQGFRIGRPPKIPPRALALLAQWEPSSVHAAAAMLVGAGFPKFNRKTLARALAKIPPRQATG
jgi:DNA invertase Pin-like site-specific DNA recombinase